MQAVVVFSGQKKPGGAAASSRSNYSQIQVSSSGLVRLQEAAPCAVAQTELDLGMKDRAWSSTPRAAP